jgi:neurotransmitter:Na+ symporter, NSS family
MTTVFWSSRVTFILAAVGAAVGLGNIWRFPYLAGTHGGGAFVVVYLGIVFAIAIPILIAELLIGRAGRGSPATAMQAVALASGRSTRWRAVGTLGTWSGFLIVSFYSVIGGWVLAYILKSASGELAGANAALATATFATLQASPMQLLLWHSVFMAATTLVVARGLERGIEFAMRWLMPALFVILLIMLGYSLTVGAAGAAFEFLFAVDASRIDGPVILIAIGQAFFSIGVAMGLMMMYAAYLPDTVSIPRAALTVGLIDTLVATVAGLVIFPLVFANGLDPAEGPGLTFVTVPIAFATMPLGQLFATAFFVLLLFAALSSAIALIEPMVARLQERTRLSRPAAATAAGAGAWLLGIASVLSFNHWADFAPLAGLPLIGALNPYELLDWLTASLMMPLGGLLIALFVGWRVADGLLRQQLPSLGPRGFAGWRWSIRVLVPCAITGIFIANLV